MCLLSFLHCKTDFGFVIIRKKIILSLWDIEMELYRVPSFCLRYKFATKCVSRKTWRIFWGGAIQLIWSLSVNTVYSLLWEYPLSDLELWRVLKSAGTDDCVYLGKCQVCLDCQSCFERVISLFQAFFRDMIMLGAFPKTTSVYIQIHYLLRLKKKATTKKTN